VDGQLRRAYGHLALASSTLPAWLADRALWSFRFTRGNRGYALFPPPDGAASTCTPAIELRAPSGRLCGRVTLPADAGSCGGVDQGWDGSVIQQRGLGACRYRLWPALLAR
jgi:hypothetical protein